MKSTLFFFASALCAVLLLSSCYTPLIIDSRDNKEYKTVRIGKKIWMAENLNYEANGSACYDNEDSNCATYGRLYDWSTAMGFASNCNTSECATQTNIKNRGVCPQGWHIPSALELDTLLRSTDSTYDNYDKSVNNHGDLDYMFGNKLGKHLKAKNGWSNNGNGDDTYGFTALPGGAYDSTSKFQAIGSAGSWWVASDNIGAPDFSYGFSLRGEKDNIFIWAFSKKWMCSIRCIKD